MPELDDPQLTPRLWDDARGLYFVPLRHHSPACARHLERLIEEIAPKHILVEGPCDFDPMIPLVAAAETRPPVAVVAFPKRGSGETAEHSVVSYFPFCGHSPEYVALRDAVARGCAVNFIDLPSSHRMMLRRSEEEDDGDVAFSLTDERAFDVSDYVTALCRRSGCRDQNELWDHFFEARATGRDWRGFFTDVGAYCAAVRAASHARDLERDGTLAREAQMLALTRRALDAAEGPVVVVTGGFHTPALIDGLADAGNHEKIVAPAAGSEAYLIRYGFRQLDILNGYAAGLPLPGFYDRLWSRLGAAEDDRLDDSFWRGLGLEILTDFTEQLRREQPSLAPPVPVLTAALESAARLAELRGRAGPLREDLLDACRSCLLKGEQLGELAPVMMHLKDFLTGSRIGDIPPSAGSPPLVEAARAEARRLGFNVEEGDERNRKLDIYRKPRHRRVSRFLHAMAFLDTRFADRTGGPDFLAGMKLDLLFETWRYAWSPMVEARLIELAAGAETVGDACLRELRRRLRGLEEEGRGRNAREAVHLFLTACQAGVAERALDVLPLIESEVLADPELPSVVTALRELFLLWRSRDVLGVAGAQTVERLIGVAYARALYLLPDLRSAREDDLTPYLYALASLREVVTTAGGETRSVDEALYREAIADLLAGEVPPAIGGALAALAYLSGLIDGEELIRRFGGDLGGAYAEPEDRIAFLRGLVAISREVLWRVPGLAARADAVLEALDEDDFIAMLPHLRLAFAALDPRETDRLAQTLAEHLQVAQTEVTGAVRYDASAEEIQRNLQLSQSLVQQLAADGLDGFLPPEAET